jgi:solute carrier family 30 (zinc transporter), member 2
MPKMEKETRLMVAIGLSFVFMLIEIVGGYFANSIAIFSDAAHLLTDIAGFIIALIATIAAKSPGTKTMTFGLVRAEVFGALGSVLSLWIITACLLYAAFYRAVAWFENKAEVVDGFLMFAVACFGICVNLCLGYVFHEDHGGAFHPAHSHDHGHASHGCGEHGHDDHKSSNMEMGVKKPTAKDKSEVDHGHSHAHGHSHGHGSGGGHDHTEKTPLLADTAAKTNSGTMAKVEPFAFAAASKCSGHDHDHGSHKDDSKAKGVEGGGGGHDHSHGHGHGHGHKHAAEKEEQGTGGCGGGSGGGDGHSHSNHAHGEEVDGDSGHAGHHEGGHGHGHYHGDHDAQDVNIEAAYLHVLTDLIQSLGVALAGAVLWWKPHWQIIDPLCTVVFSIVALQATLPLINKVGMILFEGIPSNVRYLLLFPLRLYAGSCTFVNSFVKLSDFFYLLFLLFLLLSCCATQVDWEIVMTKFQAIKGVEDVHDLHIWSISSNSVSLTCHIRVRKKYSCFVLVV